MKYLALLLSLLLAGCAPAILTAFEMAAVTGAGAAAGGLIVYESASKIVPIPTPAPKATTFTVSTATPTTIPIEIDCINMQVNGLLCDTDFHII